MNFKSFRIEEYVLISISVVFLAGCVKPPTPTLRNQPNPALEIQANKQQSVCTTQILAPEEIFELNRNGVAVISSEDKIGSGFVVSHNNGITLLLTNAHVIEEASSVKIKWIDGAEDVATIISKGDSSSHLTDLALLEVKGIHGKVLTIKSQVPSIGRDIVAIGAPRGLEFSLSRGILSGLHENAQILQIDTPINPGNSGGPVLDRTGCVVGIATFKLLDSEGLNFAVGATRINEFLADFIHPGDIKEIKSPDESTPAPATPVTPPQDTTKPNQMPDGSALVTRQFPLPLLLLIPGIIFAIFLLVGMMRNEDE
jgi:S1-C subfamily serine protease